MEGIKRIDIGCGASPKAGFEPWDIKQGRRMERLDGIANGQLEAIRASHVLEHTSHRNTLAVLQEWARALKVGGELHVAVPDFDKIVHAYSNGANLPIEGYLMGGHTDADDHHGAIFSRQKLAELLGLACFEVFAEWAGDEGDCSSVPISLNLSARRVAEPRLPLSAQTDVLCVMSMPRLAWSDNMQCVADACFKLSMPMVRTTGVFWGQCLQRMIDEACGQQRWKYILTVDYDTVFMPHDVVALRHILERNGLHALASLQMARDRDDLLTQLDDGNGQPLRSMEATRLLEEHWPCLTSHFGLTLFDIEAIRKVPRPLFLGVPNADGAWGDGRVDDDIYFWHKARAAGMRCSITPQVRVGHLQVMCTWPDSELQPVHQYVRDYCSRGRPQWNL